MIVSFRIKEFKDREWTWAFKILCRVVRINSKLIHLFQKTLSSPGHSPQCWACKECFFFGICLCGLNPMAANTQCTIAGIKPIEVSPWDIFFEKCSRFSNRQWALKLNSLQISNNWEWIYMIIYGNPKILCSLWTLSWRRQRFSK